MFERETGRLREVRVYTRPTSDNRSTITFRNFVIEMPFSLRDKIAIGQLLGVKSVSGLYLVMEIVDYIPMHYSMIGVDNSLPVELRQEIMKRVSESWDSPIPRNVWLEIYASPAGYLIDEKLSVIKRGYSPPLIGSEVRIFTKESYDSFVSSSKGVKIGNLLTTGSELRIDLDRLIKYHTGIFAFTGTGKSNLIATLIRKVIESSDYKIVIFDLSMEYAILLLDVLSNYPSKIVTTERLPPEASNSSKRLVRSHVIPEELEDITEKIENKFRILYTKEKIKHIYIKPEGIGYLTYGELIRLVNEQLEDKYTAIAQKPLFKLMLSKLDRYMRDRNLSKEDLIDSELRSLLDEVEEIAQESKLRENSSLFTFISGIRGYINIEHEEDNKVYDVESLVLDILDGKEKLFVIESPNSSDIRTIASQVINSIIDKRRRSYTTKPPIAFVIDEAQEFIPYDTRSKDNTYQSSEAIEKLLRQGRKYRLHGLISTQRLAYLNTNVIQQLHSYFISIMPRPYDRQLVAETFAISDMLLDMTLDLDVGQWLLVSFKAALPHDVPVFFNAENNIDIVKQRLLNDN
ncbi:ATPase [Sulfolobales archaeon HS-7]|nr:ATPase [Sulfolobales archaeon HS-7]